MIDDTERKRRLDAMQAAGERISASYQWTPAMRDLLAKHQEDLGALQDRVEAAIAEGEQYEFDLALERWEYRWQQVVRTHAPARALADIPGQGVIDFLEQKKKMGGK